MRPVVLACRLLPIIALAPLAIACSGGGGLSDAERLVLRDVEVDCPPLPPDQPPAHEVIAIDILTRDRGDLLLNAEDRDALEEELQRVLALLRRDFPATAGIRAIWSYVPGELLLGLEGSLRENVRTALADKTAESRFVTGHEEFDRLNARIGLRGVRLVRNDEVPDSALLCFDDLLNVPVAVEAYSHLADVAWSEPNSNLVDSPDVDAILDGDTWYFAFRDASGDCPAGCTYEQLLFFTVRDDLARQVSEGAALDDPQFQELAGLVRHLTSPDSGPAD